MTAPTPIEFDTKTLGTDLENTQQCEEELAAAGKRLTVLQREFCEVLTSKARFNGALASRIVGINAATGRAWRKREDVQRYAAALIKRQALGLLVTRGTIIQELAFLAFSDIADLWQALPESGAESDKEAGLPADPESEEGAPASAGEVTDIRLVGLRPSDLASLPRHVTRAIKKAKFEGGLLVEVQFHEKIKPLELLGQAFRAFEGPPDDPGAERTPWQGFKIIAPPKEDD